MAGLVAASRFLLAILLGGSLLAASPASADLPETIERIKPSVVVVGTYQQTRSPQFVMRGTGFVVGDGRQVATNAHVIQQALDEAAGERLDHCDAFDSIRSTAASRQGADGRQGA